MSGFGGDSNNDRLAALRSGPEPTPGRGRVAVRRPELIVAAIALALGIALLVSVMMPRGGGVQVATESTTTVAATNNARIPTGMILVAMPVERGHIPASVRPGDRVRIVATPMSDGTGTVHLVPSIVTVQSIDTSDSIDATTVISVIGESSVAAAVAASGPVHVFLVGERA